MYSNTPSKGEKKIAQAVLGEELPDGVGRAIIHMKIQEQQDAGLTWAKDDASRRFHMVYITAPTMEQFALTLDHELVHVVLATRFPHPNRLPVWIEEGIASHYDDPQRTKDREKVLAWLQKTGDWPEVGQIVSMDNFANTDVESYAVAASLVDFLLSRGDRENLLAFGQMAQQSGCDAALKHCYGIANPQQLQHEWLGWLSSPNRAHDEATARQSLTTMEKTQVVDGRRSVSPKLD